MALVFRGQTQCPICHRLILEGQSITAFSAFIWNQQDPLSIFNDAAFHDKCFKKHRLAEAATARWNECKEYHASRNRLCMICRNSITDPDNYLGLGYLTEEDDQPLFFFNYAHFHLSCLKNWSALSQLIKDLEKFDQSGKWKGDYLRQLLIQLQNYH